MQILHLSLLASAVAGVLAADAELKIEVTHAVDCQRKTKAGDKISVHYRGTLHSNGEKFDASYDRNSPLQFNLGTGQVIKGWDEGLLDMCIGEKRTLTVPPSYGYGDRAMATIPAGSTLVFETELMGIDGVPQPEPDAKKFTETSSVPITSKIKIKEHIATLVGDAAEAVQTVLSDTGEDEVQGHEEL